MHHRFAGKSKANNWKKKLVVWQTWFLKRSDFSYAAHLWKIRSEKFFVQDLDLQFSDII